MPGIPKYVGLLAGAAAVVSLSASIGNVAAQADGPPLIFSPHNPGPNAPPSGRSLFDELFEIGNQAERREDANYAIPFPFEALLESLNKRTEPERAQTALIPLGRSLQRFSAHPDYFASPRIVVAVDGQSNRAEPPSEPLLKDRLYLGYQPASQSIEVLSYNEQAGRFEFQEITGYGSEMPAVTYSERTVCTTCHQGAAPIFATALWSETNGSESVAASLSELGEEFHGIAVRQGIDGPDFFDQSTDRANLIPAAAALWRDGCAGADDPAACRGQLLLAALRYRLGGSRIPPVDPGDLAAMLEAQLPKGLWAANPDLPNRDPMILVAANTPAADAIEAQGKFDPTVTRKPVALWMPGQSASGILAALFGKSDIAWLDATLAAIDGLPMQTFGGACKLGFVDDKEIRFSCGADDASLRLDGFVQMKNGEVVGGRIDSLVVGKYGPVRRLFIETGSTGTQDTLELSLREGSQGLSARLAGGERLSSLTLTLSPSGVGRAEISIIDEITVLADAITRMDALSANTPPVRRTILADLNAQLAQEQN